MGTEVRLVAYTGEGRDRPTLQRAMADAFEEVRRLESLMTSWRKDSELSAVNEGAGSFVTVGPETFLVIEKGLWAGALSGGAFDISFEVMHDVWRFGDAQEATPRLPDPDLIAARRKHIDFRRIQLDHQSLGVRLKPGMRIGLGGIAKGYAVDRASEVLRARGVHSFLVQAGGDLYGAGTKPDGQPWVSGIRDPRGAENSFFASIDLEDHAFSTAGDYARSFFIDGKRYHHIIDPATGFPATRCRSVTVWAPDALTADAVDDAVFVLGAAKGLPLIESLPGVGALIVDEANRVWISERLKDRVHTLTSPTDGP